MTAADIIATRTAAAAVLRDHRSWFTLLHIIAAGSAGISRYQLGRRTGGYLLHASTMRNWRAAGLITVAASHIGKRPSHILRATPKAARLLRLTES